MTILYQMATWLSGYTLPCLPRLHSTYYTFHVCKLYLNYSTHYAHRFVSYMKHILSLCYVVIHVCC